MSQLTIRQIPAPIRKEINREAVRSGKSVNKTVISLLGKSLGIAPNSEKKRDLSKLAGTWTEQEEKEFLKSVEMCRQIDKELWQS